MIDPFERRLEDWMNTVGQVGSSEARQFVRSVSLPPRVRRRRLTFSMVAPIGVALVLVIAVAAIVRQSPSAGGPVQPPDPRAFAGDPRMAQCGVTDPSQAVYAFELAHASDFAATFPAAGRSPELERPDPAFVVVLTGPSNLTGQGVPPLGAGGAWVPGSSAPVTDGSGKDVCVIVGSGADVELNLYQHVDITGFNLAPRSTDAIGPTVEPIVTATDAPPEVGLFAHANAPAPGGVFTPSNEWAGWIDATTFVQVWAGDQPAFGGGGLVMVMRRPGIGDGVHLDPDAEPTQTFVPPPVKGGPLTITEVRDGLLIIGNPKGTEFLFDPASGTFATP